MGAAHSINEIPCASSSELSGDSASDFSSPDTLPPSLSGYAVFQRIMQGSDRAGGEVAGQYEKMNKHMRDKVVASREFSWDFRSNSSPLVSVRPARVVETGRLHKMRKNSLGGGQGTHTEAELGGELIFLGASGGHS